MPNQTTPSSTPVYLRVTREGNTFTGYFSQDGVQWTMRSVAEIPLMESTVYFGLVVSGYSAGTLTTTVFDRITILQPE